MEARTGMVMAVRTTANSATAVAFQKERVRNEDALDASQVLAEVWSTIKFFSDGRTRGFCGRLNRILESPFAFFHSNGLARKMVSR